MSRRPPRHSSAAKSSFMRSASCSRRCRRPPGSCSRARPASARPRYGWRASPRPRGRVCECSPRDRSRPRPVCLTPRSVTCSLPWSTRSARIFQRRSATRLTWRCCAWLRVPDRWTRGPWAPPRSQCSEPQPTRLPSPSRSTTSSGSTPPPRTRSRFALRRLGDEHVVLLATRRAAPGAEPLDLGLAEERISRIGVGPLGPDALHRHTPEPPRRGRLMAGAHAPGRGLGRQPVLRAGARASSASPGREWGGDGGAAPARGGLRRAAGPPARAARGDDGRARNHRGDGPADDCGRDRRGRRRRARRRVHGRGRARGGGDDPVRSPTARRGRVPAAPSIAAPSRARATRRDRDRCGGASTASGGGLDDLRRASCGGHSGWCRRRGGAGRSGHRRGPARGLGSCRARPGARRPSPHRRRATARGCRRRAPGERSGPCSGGRASSRSPPLASARRVHGPGRSAGRDARVRAPGGRGGGGRPGGSRRGARRGGIGALARGPVRRGARAPGARERRVRAGHGQDAARQRDRRVREDQPPDRRRGRDGSHSRGRRAGGRGPDSKRLLGSRHAARAGADVVR